MATRFSLLPFFLGFSLLLASSSVWAQTSSPATPTGLTAAVWGGSGIYLKWNTVSGASYNVYQGTSPGGEGSTPIATNVSPASSSSTSCSSFAGSLTSGKTYYFEVVAVNSAGTSGYSNEASATYGVPSLAAPVGLKAVAGSTQVGLTWNPVAGATGYNLYRSVGGAGFLLYQLNLTSTSYTDSGLTNGTSYSYTVDSVDKDGEGGSSRGVTAVPGSAILPPTKLAASFFYVGSGSAVNLNWNAVSGATSYNIYRSTSSGGEGSAPILTGIPPGSSSTSSYVDQFPSSTATYYYKITPVSANGEGQFSNEASATPGVQPLSRPTLHGLPGNAQMSLSWTAISGATSYNLYRNGAGTNQLYQVGLSTTSYPDTGLDMTQSYTYQVAGVNKDGQGNLSNSISTSNPVITSTVPANPSVLAWNPLTMASVPVSATIAGFYATNQTVNLTIYDTAQNVIKTLPAQTVILGGSGSNGSVGVNFTWDGTTTSKDSSGNFIPAPAGVYLFKFEVNPPANATPPPASYDSDKSSFLSISAAQVTLLSADKTNATYQFTYTLSSSTTPPTGTASGTIYVNDANNAPQTGSNVTLSAADLTPGPHTKTVVVPVTAVGPLTLYLSALDNGNTLDKAGRQRYALQRGARTPFTLNVSQQPWANVLAWKVQGRSAFSVEQRGNVPADDATWLSSAIPVPMPPLFNDFFWYTFDPNAIPNTNNPSIYNYRVAATDASTPTIQSNVVAAVPQGHLSNGQVYGLTQVLNPFDGTSYDWHGFLAGLTTTDSSGVATQGSSVITAAGNYSTANNNLLLTGPVGGTGTQPPFTQSIALDLTGLSFTPHTDLFWLWTPPSLGYGLGLDLVHFPTPKPLFVLAKTAASMEVKGATDLTKVMASGNFADSVTGFSLPSLGTYNTATKTWRSPADTSNTADQVAVSRAIIPMVPAFPASGIAGSDRLQTISLKPTGKLSVSNPAGNGQASLNARLYEFGFPIHMTYPDIFYRPDKPDVVSQNNALGGNQFVYNSGVLQVPAQIDLIDDTSVDTANSKLNYPANDVGDGGYLWPSGALSTSSTALVGWAFNQGSNHMAPMTNGYNLLPTSFGANPATPELPDGTYRCNFFNTSSRSVMPDDNGPSGSVSPHMLSFHGQPNSATPSVLPAANGDFGNYTVMLTVKTQAGQKPSNSENAYIQTFFSNGGTDHPNPNLDTQSIPRNDLLSAQNGSQAGLPIPAPHWDYSTGPISVPNWYHYYTQIYPSTKLSVGTSTDFWSSMSYSGEAGSLTDPYLLANPNTNGTRVYNIHIGAGVSEVGVGITSFPVFALANPTDPNSLVQLVGKITLKPGIMSYLYVSSHEYGHQHAFSSKDSKGNSVSNVDANGVVIPNSGPKGYPNFPGPNGEQEYDILSITWKGLHHLSTATSDTILYNQGVYAYPNYSTWQLGPKPDNELVADIEALGLVLNNRTLWSQDWSDAGVQIYTSSNLASKLFVPVPKTNPPIYDLSYSFLPTGAATPTDVFSYNDIQSLVDPSGALKVLQSLEELGP